MLLGRFVDPVDEMRSIVRRGEAVRRWTMGTEKVVVVVIVVFLVVGRSV